jgi:hypothetical protein
MYISFNKLTGEIAIVSSKIQAEYSEVTLTIRKLSKSEGLTDDFLQKWAQGKYQINPATEEIEAVPGWTPPVIPTLPKS